MTLSCHSGLEKQSLNAGDGVMIAILVIFGILLTIGTTLDVAVNVLELKYMPESLLPTLKGFSLYHNSKKILNTDVPTDSSSLNCINGIKYISISWIVLGHILWEYCNTSNFGVFTSSAVATGEALNNVAATVLWNGLIGVDTFLVIGGCLLSYHTMKELDKTNGGNMGMWVFFYIHRYIR